jgi:hypothetical protein
MDVSHLVKSILKEILALKESFRQREGLRHQNASSQNRGEFKFGLTSKLLANWRQIRGRLAHFARANFSVSFFLLLLLLLLGEGERLAPHSRQIGKLGRADCQPHKWVADLATSTAQMDGKMVANCRQINGQFDRENERKSGGKLASPSPQIVRQIDEFDRANRRECGATFQADWSTLAPHSVGLCMEFVVLEDQPDRCDYVGLILTTI